MTVGPKAYWPADLSVELDRRPIGEVVHGWADTTPDAPAVRSLDGDAIATLSYAEVFERSHRLACGVRASVAGGRTVGVCATPSSDWLVLEYAAALDAKYGRHPDLKARPMYCVAFSFKDVLDTADMRSTGGGDVN